MHDDEGTRFLPPEPAGPEPELGDRPPQQAQPQQQQPQAPPQQTYGYPPGPPVGGGHPPPPGQPYYQPPPPPGYGYPPPGQGYPPPWGYAQPQPPDNGQAVAGFVLSIVSLGLLFISVGLSSIVSIGCAIGGIVCGRNGKQKVDSGQTPKHRGLAQAGYIIGWVSLALSVLATIGWILFIILAATGDIDVDESNDSITAAASALRLGARFLGA